MVSALIDICSSRGESWAGRGAGTGPFWAIFATQHGVRSNSETEEVIVALSSWAWVSPDCEDTRQGWACTLLVTHAVTLPSALDSLRPRSRNRAARFKVVTN
jgi:hypothetical protein